MIDHVLRLHVVNARADIDAVAGVVADAVRRQAAECVVESFDAAGGPFAACGDVGLGVHHVIGGEERVVDLEDEAGIDDRLVFLAQRVGEGDEVILLVLVVLVAVPVGEVGRRDRRHERLDMRAPGERRLEPVDVLPERGVALVGDRAGAHPAGAAGVAGGAGDRGGPGVERRERLVFAREAPVIRGLDGRARLMPSRRSLT